MKSWRRSRPSTEFALEQHRRQHLVESLDQLRRAKAGARVVIPVEAVKQNGGGLPAGVQVEPGMLRIDFTDVTDLLAKLYGVAQAATADFDSFRAATEACHTSVVDPGASA